MVVMKGYVCNRAHPEGSMIEGYTTEEVIECCIDYIKDGNPIGVPVSQHHGWLSGKGTKGHKSFIDVTYQRVRESHFSIMQQLAIMKPYVEKNLQELHERIQDKTLMMKQHKLYFTAWLKDPHGIEVDEYGFTIIDLINVGHKGEHWVLASTVAQVFYILDPEDEKKHIVVPGKQRVVRVDNMEEE
jgi:hypothetical protein